MRIFGWQFKKGRVEGYDDICVGGRGGGGGFSQISNKKMRAIISVSKGGRKKNLNSIHIPSNRNALRWTILIKKMVVIDLSETCFQNNS